MISNKPVFNCHYIIYRGWSFEYTGFLHPFNALCWMRWMAWKDLLMHLWVGSYLNPLQHICVGHAIVIRYDLMNMSKSDNKLKMG